ncbi:iron(III) transport system permease protein [Sedimentibacter acidaminivorans]|uniref:Iron(III) transport system permease protein n=1 Tax=Sedimentibacter acidaminivorans TaxID=913099 RepID=A0ABS4G9S0_9FIRM|nr:iron ABC transporter permease [Sedimentibacter acidaminivorans]MBP1924414.1 iron(III) transport system permease protein [Sedimentibacter acidaminivorans]
MKKNSFSAILKICCYFVLFWVLIGVIVVPMLNTIGLSFHTESGVDIQNYVDYFSLENNLNVIKNTLFLGVLTIILCGIVGTTLAFYMSFIKVKNQKFIHMILLSPMMVPGVIIVIAFIQLYGESGLVTKSIQLILGLKNIPFHFNGLGGIMFVHTYTQYVYFYLNVYIALKYVDYSTIDAARGLGASRWKIFTSILFPEVLPALLSSAIITFISGISSFSAPNLIGGRYRVLSTQIMIAKANNYMNIASMQVVILMIMGISVMYLIRYYESKCAQESMIRVVPISKQKIEMPLLRWIVNIIIGATIILIIVPIIAIFLLSFVKSSSMMMDIFPKEFGLLNYKKLFSKRRVFKPFLNSINMSIITVVVGLCISIPTAYLTTKRKNKINRIAELLIMLPLAMPVSTIAINLINAFNVKNIFILNHILIGTYWILPIAYIITSLPLFMRTNIIAFESFNTSLEHASRSLGAGPLYTFKRITAPIISPAIISGSALVFIKTIGEYTMSALLYGVYNRTISIAMVNAMQEYDIGLSMSYGVLTILICFLAMTLILKLDKEIL